MYDNIPDITATTFNTAFRIARNQGLKIFKWKNNFYSTQLKNESIAHWYEFLKKKGCTNPIVITTGEKLEPITQSPTPNKATTKANGSLAPRTPSSPKTVSTKHTGGDASSDVFEKMPIPQDAHPWFPELKKALLKYRNVKYVLGQIDCSGLVRNAFCDVFGKNAVKGYTCDYQYKNDFTPISKDELKPGDVCFIDPGHPTHRKLKKADGTILEYDVQINHVATYVGDGKVYHTGTPGTPPHLSTLSDSYKKFGRYQA